jgi:predicted transposase YbfD/YdcC
MNKSEEQTKTIVGLRISELLKEHALTISIEKIKSKVVTKLLCLFKQIEDPRLTSRVKYPLNELLLALFLAILAGSETYADISRFWQLNEKLYKRLFKKDEIASHDTFRRILSLLPTQHVNEIMSEVLVGSIANLRKALKVEKGTTFYSVDGKELRGSGRKYETSEKIKNLMTLNVYDHNDETCIYSEPISDKHNEIPHAQKLLSQMNLKDSIVSFDAMHTQYKTANIIVQGKGDFIGGLKGNQALLSTFAQELCSDDKLLDKLKEGGNNYCYSSEIAHNQLEERHFYYCAITPKQKREEFGKWEKVKAIVCYDKTTRHNVTGKQTFERRYYLTSLNSVIDCSYCIRNHWGIENSLHWLMDAIMNEDDCQVVDRNAATNLSILKKSCLSMYKLYKAVTKEKISIRTTRKIFGWVFEDSLAKVLAIIDAKTLQDSLIIAPKK